MSEKPKTCSNCWSSMFRRKHGETQLYCGYWYKPVELDGVCDEHNTNGQNYNYNPVEHKRNHNRRPVYVIEPDGTLRTFDSIMRAACQIGISQNAVSRALRNGKNKVKEYEIGYIDE
jgi:hypothetical protein